MIIVLRKLHLIVALLFFVVFSSYAQNNDAFSEFKKLESVNQKFNYFFDSSEKYNINSAYDWRSKVREYLKTAASTNDTIAICKYSVILSQIHFDLGNYTESIKMANTLYLDKQRLGIEEKKILLEIMDTTYSELQLYDKQLEVRKEKIALGISNDLKLYDVYANLGLYRLAMEDYIMEVKKTLADDDYFGQAKYSNKLGDYLRMQSVPHLSIKNYNNANSFIDLFLNNYKHKNKEERNEANLLKGIILGNLGKCRTKLQEYDQAIVQLEESVIIIKKHNHGKFSRELRENMLYLSECFLQQEDYDLAKSYLDSDQYALNSGTLLKQNRLLATYYEKNKQYDSSSFFLKKYIKLKDSLDNLSMKNKVAGLLVESNIENKKETIKEQQKRIEKSDAQIKNSEKKINYTIIALVLALLGITGLFLAYRKSVRVQKVIEEQKKIIESSLIEKDSLLKEIHHRVKNNLQMVSSLLSIQTKNTKSQAAIAALQEGKSRVKAMALIHQKLYQNEDLSVIEMQGYIETLVTSIKALYSKRGADKVDIVIDAGSTELDIDRAIPFGLILNELVSNSFKYAFPDEEGGTINIHIDLEGEKEGGYFEYSDTGIGLPDDLEERTKSSMGYNLINRLVNQLKSNLNVDREAKGVRFWFNFG